MNNNIKNKLFLTILLILFINIILNTNTTINTILDYSNLFLKNIFPANFIFYIISNLLIIYGIIDLLNKIFKNNSTSLFILLISMLSGFPSGAIYTKELYNKKYISKNKAFKYLTFSHFPNPIFYISITNLVLNNNKLTILIYISILLSNLILFIKNYDNTNNYINNINNNSFSLNLNNSIKKSINIILLIYGTNIFFNLITINITKYITNSFIYILVIGLFDFSHGITSTIIINNIILRCYYILFFISFGGISIHTQVKTLLDDTDIAYSNYLYARIISSILSIIIFSILTTIIYT